MKKFALIAAIILIIAALSGCTRDWGKAEEKEEAKTGTTTTLSNPDPPNLPIDDIDDGMISEDDEVEIGDMI